MSSEAPYFCTFPILASVEKLKGIAVPSLAVQAASIGPGHITYPERSSETSPIASMMNAAISGIGVHSTL